MTTNCAYHNPINYNLDSDAYELDLPRPITVYTDGEAYEVIPMSIIEERTTIYHCVTSVEDYDYVIAEFVKKSMHMFTPTIKVQVLYYDQVLAMHATMPLLVGINKVDEAPVSDVSYRVNRRVQSYQEWQMKN